MRTGVIVGIIVVMSVLVLGAVYYWVDAYGSYSNFAGSKASTFTISIDSDTKWSGTIGGSSTRSGVGSTSFDIHSSMASACLQKQTEEGYLTITIFKDGEIVESQTTDRAFGVVAVSVTS